ncbi:hypothetical protein Flavo103_09750 [Flavobacterium collinsii]|uniref:hypothetical protein n=1 Tax=Flavobacterium collinsii TaxID=1114861 RepID=UPI0022C636BA|nr:hypothetical protein [Flavobacterium collinsii]GIQ57839.1 hypothetical protein Flavo103_09750 [Flavobacterium collinsii]
MVKKHLKYIGIVKTNEEGQARLAENYSPSENIKIAERFLNYLKEIDSYQKDRRSTIESKNSQLVGQASIVTSIFALFIPLLFDSFDGIALPIKIIVTVIFLIVLFHYLLTIFHALQTLKINKYKYATRNTTTITKSNRALTELDFLNEEISDLIFIINQTAPIDNKKGENLILGARCFEIANFGFGLMTFVIILSTFTIKKETSEVKIKNPEEIKLAIPDTITTKIKIINKAQIPKEVKSK